MEQATPTHPKHKANRDLLAQLSAVADVIQAHEEDLTDSLPPGNWENVGHPSERNTDIALFDSACLDARILGADRGNEAALKVELATARALGAQRQVARSPARSLIQQLALDFPHFESVIRLIEQRQALANLIPGRPYSLPPILLAGEPGVGKTAFAEALAVCLAQPVKRVDISAASAGFALSGSHESWQGARHGAIWSLLQNSSASGVLLLDEIDKAADSRYPVLGCLYSLLEPSSARHFEDEYIKVPVDASRLIVVATSNDVNLIERALLSRFQIFDIPTPTPEQIPAIARSVYAQLHAQEPWGQVYPETLSPEVLAVIQPYSPRELSGLLQDAVARAALHGRRRLLPEDILVQAEQIAARRQRVQTPNTIGFL